MTFFATLLFGAGTLLLISAMENVSLTDSIKQVLSGNLTITPPKAPSSGSSSTDPNPATQQGNNYPSPL